VVETRALDGTKSRWRKTFVLLTLRMQLSFRAEDCLSRRGISSDTVPTGVNSDSRTRTIRVADLREFKRAKVS
jgi:hypothetical protein